MVFCFYAVIIINMDNNKKQTLTWQAFEYEHQPKSNDWLWTLGFIVLISAGVAVYFHTYLFAIFILISGFMLIYFKVSPPHEYNIEINESSIKIDEYVHEFKNLKGYTIIEGEKPKLLIETSKHFLPIISIPMPQYAENSVKVMLSDVLPELELTESKAMLIADKLGL